MVGRIVTLGVAAILAMTATGEAVAETIVSYKAASTSPPFEIKPGVKSWRVTWKCDLSKAQFNIVPFSLTNPDHGALRDAFMSTSASGEGSAIRTDKGRLRIDTNKNLCDVTVSTID
jgi:hypothetical protein